jgi:hypothetical protein
LELRRIFWQDLVAWLGPMEQRTGCKPRHLGDGMVIEDTPQVYKDPHGVPHAHGEGVQPFHDM